MATHADPAKAAAPVQSAPALAAPRPFAAHGTDPGAVTPRLGHDLGHIAVDAPIQRKPGARVGRKKLAKFLYPKPAPARAAAPAAAPPAPVLAPVIAPAQAPVTPSRERPDVRKRQKSRRKQEWRERRARKQQGRSAGPLDTLAVSRTTRPLESDDVRDLEDSGTVDPHSIHTTQDTATSRFTDDRSVLDTARALRAHRLGGPDPEIPPIDIIRREDPDTGQLSAFTLDNRRLYAHRRANVEVPYRLSEGRKAEKDFKRKFSSRDEGRSIRIVPSESERVPYTPEDLHGELEDE